MVTSTEQRVPVWANYLLSASDLAAIETVVQSAERKTAGEIVPMIVYSSTPLTTPRRLLFFCLMLAMAVCGNLYVVDWWTTTHVLLEGALIAAAIVVSFVLPIPAWLMRLLMTSSDLKALVEQRAEVEFYRCRLQHTKAKTGILLFVSLAEHRAVVLADESIASRLPASTWDEVLALMLSGIRARRAGQGIVQAVERCGMILAQHFPREHDDQDELGNRVILKQ